MPSDPSADQHTEVVAEAPDGARLVLRGYEPDGGAVRTVLALPGIGVPQRVFRHVGGFMAERGLRVVSLDYRGQGDSQGELETRTASLTTWATVDVPAALACLEARYGRVTALLAHSFGGQALALCPALEQIEHGVLVASQLAYRHHWRGLARLKLEFFWQCLLPLTTVGGRTMPRWVVGGNVAHGVAAQWRRWAMNEDWFFTDFPDAAPRMRAHGADLRLYVGEDDFVAPLAAVQDFGSRFGEPLVPQVLAPQAVGRPTLGHVGLLLPGGTEDLWGDWCRFFLGNQAD